ncbi:MAG: aminoacyl-tRNA hydrolase [Deltaproteobacteria bacterium]|nr:aminoacyl-tRNA hydrolase [Deltaproteobacteria bacterium]
MKIVVGLGNPGPRYAATRHNIGARIVERFATDCGFALSEHRFESRFGLGKTLSKAGGPPDGPNSDVALLVPETYMNRSGIAVAEALSGLPVDEIPEDLLIVVDDLDLPFGQLRIRPRGSSAGHRGLEDIAERIGTTDFPRLRFGIGRPEGEIDTVDWVLDTFSEEEEAALGERIAVAAEAVGSILVDGVVASMNRYNRSPETGD